MRPLLEIAVDTVAGLDAALQGKADRIELCAALSEGGLTPSPGFMTLAAEAGLPVRAMIRPRAGDFTYSLDELAVMRADIAAAAEAGLEGVVFGVNHADGRLDQQALEDLCGQARDFGLACALHRSFDLTPDPSAALVVAMALGFDTVLTSGQARTASEGVARLQTLLVQAEGRIEILAGGGVRADTADRLLKAGLRALHASCRATLPPRNDRATELGYVTPDQMDTNLAEVRFLRERMNVFSGEIA